MRHKRQSITFTLPPDPPPMTAEFARALAKVIRELRQTATTPAA